MPKPLSRFFHETQNSLPEGNASATVATVQENLIQAAIRQEADKVTSSESESSSVTATAYRLLGDAVRREGVRRKQKKTEAKDLVTSTAPAPPLPPNPPSPGRPAMISLTLAGATLSVFTVTALTTLGVGLYFYFFPKKP